MSRVSIRVRVAAAFAVAMALVLTATGIFLYAQLGRDLAHALDRDLRLRVQDVAQVVSAGGSLAALASRPLIEREESFAQVLGARGVVLDASRPLGRRPLLSASERTRALRGPLFLDRAAVPSLDEPARLLAVRARRAGAAVVLVVGRTREDRAEALRSLRTKLLVAGPFALLVATLLGYAAVGGGLRAVDVMRRRAQAISGATPGARLPVPQTGDELERLGITLNEMLGRLEDALAREQAFVADAGHELRGPLALLRAELDVALEHAETEAELRAALRAASRETDRLAQLSGDLLLIAGASGGEVALRRESLPAVEVLDSVRNRFALRAAQEQRRMVCDAPAGLVLRGDRIRLEQAMGNLVENALRHGAGTIRLTARLAAPDTIDLEVADEGPGFDAAFVPHAFGRFTRGPASHVAGGAGLGLAIVDAIARAHGGSASVVASADGGAMVRMTIPEDAGESVPPQA